jgi:hypothetical protein
MNIRQAKPLDYPQLLQIYNQAVLAGGLTGDEPPLSLEERLPWLERHDALHYSQLLRMVLAVSSAILPLALTARDALLFITPLKSPITLMSRFAARVWLHN